MRRTRALRPEVFHRLHQPATEVGLPDVVDDDPGCQGILPGEQPLREAEAVLFGVGEFAKEGRDVSGNFIALVQKTAPDADDGGRVFDFCVLRGDEHGGDAEGSDLRLQILDLPAKRGEFFGLVVVPGGELFRLRLLPCGGGDIQHGTEFGAHFHNALRFPGRSNGKAEMPQALFACLAALLHREAQGAAAPDGFLGDQHHLAGETLASLFTGDIHDPELCVSAARTLSTPARGIIHGRFFDADLHPPDFHVDLVDLEIAVVIAARATSRQAGIGDCFESQRGELARWQLRLHRVDVLHRVGAGGENGGIIRNGQHGGGVGFCRRWPDGGPGLLGVENAVFPRGLLRDRAGGGVIQLRLLRVEFFLNDGEFRGLVGGGQVELRFGERSCIAFAGGSRLHIVRVIEERHHLVELLLREGVEFVVVALGAANGGAEEGGADGCRAVNLDVPVVLFGVHTAFRIKHRVSEEAGGDLLLLGGVRQHVTRNLLEGELVERHVAIQCLDDPVAIRPHGAARVFFVAVGVCVPRQIQPHTSPAFAVVVGGEQAIHHSLVRIGAHIFRESVHLSGRWRQANQVEIQAAQECVPGSFGGGRQALFRQTVCHEVVDGVAPCRDYSLRRRQIRPVFLTGGGIGPFGALIHPLANLRDLVGRQRRHTHRHPCLAALSCQTLHQVAVRSFTRSNRARCQRTHIQTKAAGGTVPAVAAVAGFLQHRLDVLDEIHGYLSGECQAAGECQDRELHSHCIEIIAPCNCLAALIQSWTWHKSRAPRFSLPNSSQIPLPITRSLPSRPGSRASATSASRSLRGMAA